MAESRVLVIESGGERARTLAGLLRFIDYSPVVQPRCSGIATSGARPSDWVAVVLGNVPDETLLPRFITWLRRDANAPRLLLMPEHHARAATRLGLEPGAWVALEQPLRYAQLSEELKRAGLVRMAREAEQAGPGACPAGNSPAVRQLRRAIQQVAGFDTTVLITGEAGTGKEAVARAIHQQSARRTQPFIPLHCGAMPQAMLEDELFGADAAVLQGRFARAAGGTLFLDEVAELGPAAQDRLLRALDRPVRQTGGDEQPLLPRLIAASRQPLEQAVAEGRFRQDLFYRLEVFPIETPPLRERLEDLPVLATEIITRLAHTGGHAVSLTPEAIHALRAHHWPGNVRELANLIERLAVLHPGATVGVHDLPSRYQPEPEALPDALPQGLIPVLPPMGVDLKDHIERIEVSLIRQALSQSGGVVAHAARLLNTRRTTLVEKLRKYGLHREGVGDALQAGDGEGLHGEPRRAVASEA